MAKRAYIQFGKGGESMLTKCVSVKEKHSKAWYQASGNVTKWMILNESRWLRVCVSKEGDLIVKVKGEWVKVILEF